MPARHQVCGDSQALARQPTLELGWKESVIAPYKNARWDGRPRLESAGRSKHGIRLTRLALRPGFVNHRLRYVMEKVDERIERSVGRATVVHVLLSLRFIMTSISPPFTGSLSGFWD